MTLFPKPVIDAFRNAVAEFDGLSVLFDKYTSVYAVGEWDCTPVVNELRYAGQHLCRSLPLTGEVRSDKQNEELIRAVSHCHRAMYDANDYLILFFGGAIRDAIRDALVQCKSKEVVAEFRKLQSEYFDICSHIASLRRLDRGTFYNSRKRLIEELEQVFLDVMEGRPKRSLCGQSGGALSALKKVDTCYDGGFDNEDIINMFNETEKHLKLFELYRCEMNTSLIRDIFVATCCLVMESDEKQCRETFLRECSRVDLKILYQMLYFLSKETGCEINFGWYERCLRKNLPCTKLKEDFLKDIEKCIHGAHCD